MIVAEPISRTVGHSRSAISEPTGCWYCQESPSLPWKVCPRSCTNAVPHRLVQPELLSQDRHLLRRSSDPALVSAATGSDGIQLKITNPMTISEGS